MVTTLAGAARQYGSADGSGNAARFYRPPGVAVDSAGNVYVADTYNYEIRKVTPAGVVTTLAGIAGYGSADGTGNAASFWDPSGVAMDSAGNVYVADTYNDEIRKITPAGVVTTLAGAAAQTGSADGTGSAARFNNPTAWRWTARATSTWPTTQRRDPQDHSRRRGHHPGRRRPANGLRRRCRKRRPLQLPLRRGGG